jgi:hypothetical protein
MSGCLKWVIILALLPFALYTLFWIGVGLLVFLGLMAS